MKELPVDLKALDPTYSRVNLYFLLIAYRHEHKGVIIYTEVYLEGIAAWVITYKEGRQILRWFTD